MHQLQPTIGQWYRRRDKEERFEVVGIDEDEGTVELQNYDGALDEVDKDAWYALDIETSRQPEDLMGVFDLAPPDEADGGDPLEPDVAPDDADAVPLRVVDLAWNGTELPDDQKQ
jgi:hypothetical protein